MPIANAKHHQIKKTLLENGSLNTLVAAVKAASLKGDGPFTVFALTDETFESYLKGLLKYC